MVQKQSALLRKSHCSGLKPIAREDPLNRLLSNMSAHVFCRPSSTGQLCADGGLAVSFLAQ